MASLALLIGQSVPHVHIHILPRQPSDFTPVDGIYEKIDAVDIPTDYQSNSIHGRREAQLKMDSDRNPVSCNLIQHSYSERRLRSLAYSAARRECGQRQSGSPPYSRRTSHDNSIIVYLGTTVIAGVNCFYSHKVITASLYGDLLERLRVSRPRGVADVQ